jgi:hypothetical protein
MGSKESPVAGGFSFASVLLSFLMIAGGIAAAVVLLSELDLEPFSSLITLCAVFGGGAFVGGFFAARASRGETIAEPAVGAVLLVGALAGLILATPMGRVLYNVVQEHLLRAALVSAGSALGGALVGAFLSEKLFGAATTWSFPWILYVALAVAGGCFVASLAAGIWRYGNLETSTLGGQVESDRAMGLTVFAGIAGGCVLAGLAAGASSRRRVLFASFLGAVAGVFGFFILTGRLVRASIDQNTLIGAGLIALGGGVITLASTALGWAVVGKRYAE